VKIARLGVQHWSLYRPSIRASISFGQLITALVVVFCPAHDQRQPALSAALQKVGGRR
jgi:hypothetical protein